MKSAYALLDHCAPFFQVGAELAAADPEWVAPAALREHTLASLKGLSATLEQEGVTPTDSGHVVYALAAYLDETAQFSEWPGRSAWAAEPLQVTLFGEPMAGVRFFERLDTLRGSSPAVAAVYYCCIALGFAGRYRMGDRAQLDDLLQRLRAELFGKGASSLAAHPTHRLRRPIGRQASPVVWVAVAAVGLAIVTVALLVIAMTFIQSGAIEQLAALRT